MGDLNSGRGKANMLAEYLIHKQDLIFTDNEYLITRGEEFVNFLQHNSINVSNYKQIIFKLCDLGKSINYEGQKILSFAQDVANASQRPVLAGADLYIFSNGPAGGFVAKTSKPIDKTNPSFREVIGRSSMILFEPKK